MYSVLNCHNVVKHTEFNLGYLRFNVTSSGNAGCFKEALNGTPKQKYSKKTFPSAALSTTNPT
jgi:hypothetical protein